MSQTRLPRYVQYYDRCLEYEEENVTLYQVDPEIKGFKCPNYRLCEMVLPVWWWEVKGHYQCTNCDIIFGTWGTQVGKGALHFENDLECPVCMNVGECVSYPRCDHKVCISCFRRCWFGDESRLLPFPDFPCPDLEDEFYETSEDSKWKDIPAIREWIEEETRISDENEIIQNAINEEVDRNENLRLCPLCRK